MEVSVAVLGLVAFALAGGIAIRYPGAHAWNFVDLVYYPLAAIGVTLLFLNNADQRRLLDLGQQSAVRRSALDSLLVAEPKVAALPDDGISQASWGLLGSVAEMGRACRQVSSMDAPCIVTGRLLDGLEGFLRVARDGPHPRAPIDLLKTCAAAVHMLENLALSSFIAEELQSEYKRALSKGYSTLSYAEVSRDSKSLEERLRNTVAGMRRLAPGDDDSTRLVFDIFEQESRYASTVLLGLYPCVVAPTKDLAKLENWARSRQTESDQLSQIETERKRLRDADHPDPNIAWVNLNLWPFVLLLALSLKFGKGVAALSKHSASSNQKTTNADKGELPLTKIGGAGVAEPIPMAPDPDSSDDKPRSPASQGES